MLPKITELEFDTDEIVEDLPKMGKSFSYDFEKGDFNLKDGKLIDLRELESLKLWIIKTIKTERYRFRIYDNKEYGTTIEALIGTNFPRPFVESELKREITTSLLRHELIEGIESWRFQQIKDKMYIYFTVITVEGAFEMEVYV